MEPEVILNFISQWAPVVTAVAGIVGVVVAAITKVKNATKSTEDKFDAIANKLDLVVQENLELKKQLNQKYQDDHKIYNRNHGRK